MSDNHFDTYRKQTRVKHEILGKYLYSFYSILERSHHNLLYVDGFAGAGEYESEGGAACGSPLIALDLFSKNKFGPKVSALFIEADKTRCESLAASVKKFQSNHSNLRVPMVENGAFAIVLREFLAHVTQDGKHLAPCVMFVDPCGVKGVSFDVMAQFLNQPSSEALIFFNLDGVRRIAGLNDRIAETLPELFGSRDRANELIRQLHNTASPEEREVLIVNTYQQVIQQQTKAKFITMFRIEHASRRVTSHYLIHATSHHIGFRIMKDVMWGLGETREGRGAFALEQASRNDPRPLMGQRDDDARKIVLTKLRKTKLQVSWFETTAAEDAGCLVAPRHFKEVLLKMESEGLVEVLDKETGTAVVQACRRPKRLGKATLGSDYWLRLAPGVASR